MAMTSRRQAMGMMAAALGAALIGLPRAALALDEAEARSFVDRIVADVTSLVQSGTPESEQAVRFTQIFEQYAAVPRVASFIMGQAWRDMSDAQKDGFIDALKDYVGRVYARLLADYQGQTIEVTGAQDFGAKGVLVYSLAKGAQVQDSKVEWLVSDRGGKGPQLIDITVEGVSLLQSQRQEFAAKLEKRNGDVDQLISDLRSE